jgi:hypothetical protein
MALSVSNVTWLGNIDLQRSISLLGNLCARAGGLARELVADGRPVVADACAYRRTNRSADGGAFLVASDEVANARANDRAGTRANGCMGALLGCAPCGEGGDQCEREEFDFHRPSRMCFS